MVYIFNHETAGEKISINKNYLENCMENDPIDIDAGCWMLDAGCWMLDTRTNPYS
jgi:hypothetical protein